MSYDYALTTEQNIKNMKALSHAKESRKFTMFTHQDGTDEFLSSYGLQSPFKNHVVAKIHLVLNHFHKEWGFLSDMIYDELNDLADRSIWNKLKTIYNEVQYGFFDFSTHFSIMTDYEFALNNELENLDLFDGIEKSPYKELILDTTTYGYDDTHAQILVSEAFTSMRAFCKMSSILMSSALHLEITSDGSVYCLFQEYKI